MISDRAIRSVVDLIVRCLDPQAVYLFGSTAQGRTRSDSDIDLMVLAPFHESPHRRGMELRGLVGDGVVPVDLHLLTPEEFKLESRQQHSLASTVLKYGKEVYRREE